MEQYQRVSLARQKKRTLMKKEKDSAWKALRDREHLIKQLEKDWIEVHYFRFSKFCNPKNKGAALWVISPNKHKTAFDTLWLKAE